VISSWIARSLCYRWQCFINCWTTGPRWIFRSWIYYAETANPYDGSLSINTCMLFMPPP